MIRSRVRPLLFQQGPKKRQIQGDSLASPREEWHGSALQESAGFGDSKRGHVPEIETLSHRPGEHRVWPETGETGVIDCFFSGDSLKTGALRSWVLQGRDWEAAIFTLVLQS